MMDIAYFGYEDGAWNHKKKFKDAIETAFREVKLDDADDDIKGARWEVELPDEKEDEYFKWLMLEGWHGTSLHLGIAMRDEEEQPRIKKLLAEVKEEMKSLNLKKDEGKNH